MPGTVAPVADERDGLMSYLAQQRLVLRTAAYGLTDEQARATPTVSTLSVGGLIKHVASVERQWLSYVLQRPIQRGTDDYLRTFQMTSDDTLSGLLDDYAAAGAETDEAVRVLPLDHPVPVPRHSPWLPQDVDAWSVRWVLLHLIEETARHAGHADILRESIDGATAFPLMAAAEGWPATPWMEPWRPRS
jgi:uncharacterized damage-inducible protein DinB